MFKICLLSIASIAFISCNQVETESSTVKHSGSMKRVMMEKEISPVLSSDTLIFTDLYALGALGNLKGELLVWDGEPLISREIKGAVAVSNSREFDATIYVGAQVAKWQEVRLASLPSQGNFIEVIMAKSAEQKGWDGKSPFPFRLEGKFEKLAYHVINWSEGDTLHSHEKHRTSGVIDTLQDVEAQMLGFYSNRHHGIFTHHGSNVHIHFKTKDGQIAGHVDDFEPGTELTMYLPEKFK